MHVCVRVCLGAPVGIESLSTDCTFLILAHRSDDGIVETAVHAHALLLQADGVVAKVER